MVFDFSTSDEKLASCVTKVAHQSQPADATLEVTQKLFEFNFETPLSQNEVPQKLVEKPTETGTFASNSTENPQKADG